MMTTVDTTFIGHNDMTIFIEANPSLGLAANGIILHILERLTTLSFKGFAVHSVKLHDSRGDHPTINGRYGVFIETLISNPNKNNESYIQQSRVDFESKEINDALHSNFIIMLNNVINKIWFKPDDLGALPEDWVKCAK